MNPYAVELQEAADTLLNFSRDQVYSHRDRMRAVKALEHVETILVTVRKLERAELRTALDAERSAARAPITAE